MTRVKIKFDFKKVKKSHMFFYQKRKISK